VARRIDTNAVAVLCCGLACAACDAITSVRGTVRDPAGQPISSAHVEVGFVRRSTPVRMRRSDASGRYETSLTHGLRPGPIRMRTQGDGFRTAETQMDANKDYECDATLSPLGTEAAPSSVTCRELRVRVR
jgi:hypothetical protein